MKLLSTLTILIWFQGIACETRVFSEDFNKVSLRAKIDRVQPMTGIVLWTGNEILQEDRKSRKEEVPIQLEFIYMGYDQIVKEKGIYNWEPVEKILKRVALRKHQAIIRWHDCYVGKATGVPQYIKKSKNYHEIEALSEKKKTGFPDWSNQEWQDFLPDFFTQFAKKYQIDPRIAFVEVGFGLWGEYHIYDGPMKLGKTFPSKSFQTKFMNHLDKTLQKIPWMISIDAAGDHTPFANNPQLLQKKFGLFDDSFNQKNHSQENEPNWRIMGLERWKSSPMGGEFSFFEDEDQKKALSIQGAHGIPFSRQAAKFHISFMIGDDQPNYQSLQTIKENGLACGYRFQIIRFETSPSQAKIVVKNIGIAPIYYDAFPAIDGVRSKESLKGLLPFESKSFLISKGGRKPKLTIECDHLVPGQRIDFEANLP